MSDTIYRQEAIDAIYEHEFSNWCDKDEVSTILNDLPSADRPQGYWIKVYIATYRCSKCGKTQIADDENELNYCCCCGSHNKIRKVIGDHNE